MAFRENIFISVHIKITRNVSLIDHKMTTGAALTGLSTLQKRTELRREYVGDRTGWQEGKRDEYDQNIKHFVYMYQNMKEYKHLKNISSAKKKS